jgi:phage-related protein
MVDRPPLTPFEWMGSAREDLRDFPEAVQDDVGYALYVAQRGEHPLHVKRLKGELGGLIEIVEDFDGNAYRAVYTLKLRGAIYVLHVFQKKSTRGIATPRREIELIKAQKKSTRRIATPKPDLALIRQRWQRAKDHYTTHHAAK